MSGLNDPDVQRRSRDTYRRRLDEAFWSRTDRSGECWLWTGARRYPDQYGQGNYGVLKRYGKHLYAHRVAYERAVGPIPPGMFVLHSCDNPPCIRPDHLSVGTTADNMADAAAKGRCASGVRTSAHVRGEAGHPHPFGNRETRRSDQGKAAIQEELDKRAQMAAEAAA